MIKVKDEMRNLFKNLKNNNAINGQDGKWVN